MRGVQKNTTLEAVFDSYFHQVYEGRDAVDWQDTIEDEWISCEERFQRSLDMYWITLEPNTKKTVKTALGHWKRYIDEKKKEDPMFTCIVHPISKVVKFLDWLREQMVAKNSKNPVGTVENARHALYRLRLCQRGIPRPEYFADHPLMKHSWALAKRATVEYRTSCENDLMRMGFCASTLSKDELKQLIETAVRHEDTLMGTTVAFMVSVGTSAGFRADDLCGIRYSTFAMSKLEDVAPVPMSVVHMALNDGKTNKEGWIQYSGIARHKDPLLDAQGYLADKLFYDLHIAELPLLSLIAAGDKTWRSLRILYKHPTGAYVKQKYDDMYHMFKKIVDTLPNQKSKALHLFRDTGVVWLAQHGVSLDVMRIWGRWVWGTMGASYIDKNPLAALEAFAALSGWGKDFQSNHALARAAIEVPDKWVDAITMNARKLTPLVDNDFGAQSLLQTIIHLGSVFWQTLPFKIKHFGDDYCLCRLPVVQAIIRTDEYRAFSDRILSQSTRGSPEQGANANVENMLQLIIKKLESTGIQENDKATKEANVTEGAGVGGEVEEVRVRANRELLDVGKENGEVCVANAVPRLFSQSLRTVHEAWNEWESHVEPMLERVKKNKGLKLGDRNVKAMAKNRHLAEYIKKQRNKDDFVTIMEGIRTKLKLSLPQLREGMRMMNQIENADGNAGVLQKDWSTLVLGTKLEIRTLWQEFQRFL